MQRQNVQRPQGTREGLLILMGAVWQVGGQVANQCAACSGDASQELRAVIGTRVSR